jgi:hypothetical protein
MNLDEDLKTEKDNLMLTDREIFTKIWISPRVVFKYLNDTKYDKFVNVLLILAGITRTLDRAATKNLGDNSSLIEVLGISIIVGGLIGWIIFYIYAALTSWTGKWLKGTADTNSLLRMISYAMIPFIANLIILISQIAIFGNGIFQSNTDIYGVGLLSIIVFYFTLSLEIVIGIWTLVIYTIGISEVQKFSIGKSIINMILPGSIIIGAIGIVALLINLIK